jgi:hypothetical protein
MNKLEIDTEKNKFLLNGKPIKNATEITVKFTPNRLPEVKLTVISKLAVKMDNCNLNQLGGNMDVSKEEREKAKATAIKILEQFQSNGLTEKEVKLTVFWLKSISDDIMAANQFKNNFSLPKI